MHNPMEKETPGMTQTEQDRIAAATMTWVRQISAEQQRNQARRDELNGKMAGQQYRHNKAKKAAQHGTD